MTDQPLHVKYRPKTLKEFRGHAALKDSLREALDGESMPHAFAFYGPRGCGKTTLGRIVAGHLGCEEFDLIEKDMGSNKSIESIRELIGRVSLRPFGGIVKVYILDEVHNLRGDAQDALLKTLEEGPSHTYFVLCSTEPQKLKATIKSRCAEYTVSRLGVQQINELLDHVCEKEDYPENVPSDEVLDVVAEAADGIPRDALVYLAMVKDFTDAELAREIVGRGFGEQSVEFNQLLSAVLNREPVRKILACYRNLPERDPVKLRIGLINSVKVRMMNSRSDKEIDGLANVLQYFVRLINYEVAEAELVLDLYLASKGE